MLREYRRSGRAAYLDPIRGFLVFATPEERVRQEFILRLMDEYDVPQSTIEVEYRIPQSRGRVDIVIQGASGPLMLVECKEPGTPLHDGVHRQA